MNNPGGRCKWYRFNGQSLQGTWELRFAKRLTELEIDWIKVRKPWRYVSGEKTKNYTPDFYLPENDTFVELKGYWWGRDKEKMELVTTQYPDRKLWIIEKKEFEKFLSGEQVG